MGSPVLDSSASEWAALLRGALSTVSGDLLRCALIVSTKPRT
jgi:hypothetical protein